MKDVSASTHHARSRRQWLNIANSAILICIDSFQGLNLLCTFLIEARKAFSLSFISVARMSTCIYLGTSYFSRFLAVWLITDTCKSFLICFEEVLFGQGLIAITAFSILDIIYFNNARSLYYLHVIPRW